MPKKSFTVIKYCNIISKLTMTNAQKGAYQNQINSGKHLFSYIEWRTDERTRKSIHH